MVYPCYLADNIVFCLMDSVLKHKVGICRECNYHPHLREVDQALFCEVGRAFLDERQVGQVHAQIWHTWWVTAAQK